MENSKDDFKVCVKFHSRFKNREDNKIRFFTSCFLILSPVFVFTKHKFPKVQLIRKNGVRRKPVRVGNYKINYKQWQQ